MSTRSADPSSALEGCRVTDEVPVAVPASSLDSTAPDYLRAVKTELGREGKVPAELTVAARFDADCSLATQEEVDRLRAYVDAASFLGAGRVTVRVEAIACPEKVRPALDACRERARREGVDLTVERE